MSECKSHLLSQNWQDVPKLGLGLKLHDPYVFGPLEVFKTRLRHVFEPPRDEFRTRSELLELKQGKRDAHAYVQHIRLLVSCITANPVH